MTLKLDSFPWGKWFSKYHNTWLDVQDKYSKLRLRATLRNPIELRAQDACPDIRIILSVCRDRWAKQGVKWQTWRRKNPLCLWSLLYKTTKHGAKLGPALLQMQSGKDSKEFICWQLHKPKIRLERLSKLMFQSLNYTWKKTSLKHLLQCQK